GRYFTMDVTGKLQMPGEDGKMKDMQFKGMAVEGYDNMKKKFVSSWIDNMGTGIQYSEGTYDPASKTFTFSSEMEMMPGMKTPVREVLKMADKDHMMMEWYETHGGQEKKTMEIAYTRAGKKERVVGRDRRARADSDCRGGCVSRRSSGVGRPLSCGRHTFGVQRTARPTDGDFFDLRGMDMKKLWCSLSSLTNNCSQRFGQMKERTCFLRCP